MTDTLKTLLANRIKAHSDRIESARGEMTAQAFNAKDYAKIAQTIASSLEVISELQRIWEATFGEEPTMHDVYAHTSL